MADGSMQQIHDLAFGEPRLGRAAGARSSLWARCGCGRTAPIDPRPWLDQGLARHPVEALEDRLRCLCGARRARLEIRGLAEAPPGAAAGIWVFR